MTCAAARVDLLSQLNRVIASCSFYSWGSRGKGRVVIQGRNESSRFANFFSAGRSKFLARKCDCRFCPSFDYARSFFLSGRNGNCRSYSGCDRQKVVLEMYLDGWYDSGCFAYFKGTNYSAFSAVRL